MTTELYKKHRPRDFDQIFGQNTAVETLRNFVERGAVPHTILFSGGSGNGKTTLARILKEKLNCGDHDCAEMNCADLTGVDTVRSIRARMHQSPMSGDCRIWLIDEAHRMSPQAQDALLKMLEDTPKKVYFFLATTLPEKLLRTIRTRATEIKVVAMTDHAQKSMIQDVLTQAEAEVSSEVIDAIVLASEGSARKALVILNQVYMIEDEETQLRLVTVADELEKEAISIARSLFGKGACWKKTAAILKAYKGEPETARWVVLSYATTMVLNGGNARAYEAIRLFEDAWYDSKKAGLVAACFEFFQK